MVGGYFQKNHRSSRGTLVDVINEAGAEAPPCEMLGVGKSGGQS